MKNFPHQFNDLDKLSGALQCLKELVVNNRPITDDVFGELLTRSEIYTYRDKSLSIDEFLALELKKPVANRGYLTVARDIRRLFELLGFLRLNTEKQGELSPNALLLTASQDHSTKIEIWRESFLNLCLEADNEISHPYRILLKLAQDVPGLETIKLMLALEAINDSSEEYERILSYTELPYDEILEITGTSESMAKNAVKILPGVAEQLGDITRRNNKTFPTRQVLITEDDISSELFDINEAEKREYITYRKVTKEEIGKNPVFGEITASSIDLTESIKIRQIRSLLHQKIVRQLGELCHENGLILYEGKFDCLATNDDNSKALLFEIKTITKSLSDQEKQTVKAVGQLKYYKHSIVKNKMNITDIKEFIVFSEKPDISMINFCKQENIDVLWTDDILKIYINEEKAEAYTPNFNK